MELFNKDGSVNNKILERKNKPPKLGKENKRKRKRYL